jgi:CDP-6-deoxy-D-xylo-4-hexulose-3-dehydrase
MPDKKEQILKLVSEYINEKNASQKWTPGHDFVQYAGHYFSDNEYCRAIGTFLNGWLGLAGESKELEGRFPRLMGKEFGVVTSSGSSANLLMMAALASSNLNAFPKGSKVLVPVAGFPTTLNPLLQMGFEPVFVDIELDTLNIDLNNLEETIQREKPKAITFAHSLGNPPNMARIMDLVKKYNLILLEDCCDALGSTYDGNLLGSYGEFASCSFYPAHHITGGEGGFVSCRTAQQEKVLRGLRDWGRDCYCSGKTSSFSKNGCCGRRFSNWLPLLPNEICDHKYIYTEIGYNLKPIELQCSMLLEQIKKLPIISQTRKKNYNLLSSVFSKYENYFILPRATEKSDPSWFAFPLTIKNAKTFNRFNICNFLEDKKIQTRNYFGGNLLLQPAYQSLGYSKDYALSFKNATKVTTDTFFLGVSPVITEEQIQYVGECVDEFMSKF